MSGGKFLIRSPETACGYSSIEVAVADSLEATEFMYIILLIGVTLSGD